MIVFETHNAYGRFMVQIQQVIHWTNAHEKEKEGLSHFPIQVQ